MNFTSLGLLIIDEEQRFGVAQKEKIKKWHLGIDVLSLSATPIPRTLHMALVNGRDMSVIESPPEDRLPVETYVSEYNDGMIKEALERELRRGGRIYYISNRVSALEPLAAKLRRLVPGISIKIAHGQMNEDALEDAMITFYEGGCDVLLCTTIVENGLDVPLANTIIIDGADNFGLSQLYQMRGRVGRSSRLAYAYFVYQPNKALSEIAEKRLQAIRDFTELGAGFKIAMRDLEIRGAGNLLGPQQHGHITGIGFAAYCEMLEKTIERLKTARRPSLSWSRFWKFRQRPIFRTAIFRIRVIKWSCIVASASWNIRSGRIFWTKLSTVSAILRRRWKCSGVWQRLRACAEC